jgi:hypothetical protein
MWNWRKRWTMPSISPTQSCPSCSLRRRCYFLRRKSPGIRRTTKTFPSEGEKQKGGFSFESPPSAIRFFEDLLRRTDSSNAVPESFGIREQARAPTLFPLSHPLKELPHCLLETSLPSLWEGLCRLSSLEDCSSVSKNNSIID